MEKQKQIELYSSFIKKAIDMDVNKIFCSPVTPDILPDYSLVISEPMDLGTMLSKVADYTSFDAVWNDMNKIVTNCEKYHGVDSNLTQLAFNLRKQWKILYINMKMEDKTLASSQFPAKSSQPVTPNSLPYALLFSAIAVSTPFFYTQILRAICDRVLHLVQIHQLPTQDGKLEPMIYQYLQLINLSDHLSELCMPSSTTFRPLALLSQKVGKDVPDVNCDMLNLLVQQLITSYRNESDEKLFNTIKEGITNTLNRHLLYAFCQVQTLHAIELQKDRELFDQSRRTLFDVLQIIASLSEDTLVAEWHWIDSIALTVVSTRVCLSSR